MAHINHFTFCILGLGLFFGVKISNAQSYKAAVVAFKPDRGSPRDLPNEVEEKNKDKYVASINDMRTLGAEIIVFPEKGITTLSPDKIDLRFQLDPYSIDVPNPSPNANLSNSILAGISAAAKANQVYVVINVLEKQKGDNNLMDYFSTDLVFDKQGKLLSKCRKKHLYEEKNYTESSTKDLCTFEANFSENRKVKFALLFDTDLLSPIDGTIYNAIVTSSLPNKLPFFFGLSLQTGFSVRNQINLLASGYTDPDHGYGGTGIYFRNGTSKVTIGSDTFLISDVPLQQHHEKEIYVKVLMSAVPNLLQGISYDDLNNSALSTHDKSVKEQFSEGSYCNMKLDINGNNILPYEWMAFKNKTNILGNSMDVLVCALIKSNINSNQKGIINIATIEVLKKGNVAQILPLSLEVRSDATLVPSNFHYTEEKNNGDTTIKMQLTEQKDLQGFGIIIVSHSTSVRVTQMVLIGSLSFLAYLRMGLFI